MKRRHPRDPTGLWSYLAGSLKGLIFFSWVDFNLTCSTDDDLTNLHNFTTLTLFCAIMSRKYCISWHHGDTTRFPVHYVWITMLRSKQTLFESIQKSTKRCSVLFFLSHAQNEAMTLDANYCNVFLSFKSLALDCYPVAELCFTPGQTCISSVSKTVG